VSAIKTDNVRRYVTPRTSMWRTRSIAQHFVETIDKIEEFGCYNLSVFSNDGPLPFTYSTGIYDTTSKPELIAVGLPPNVAHHALLYAFELMEGGVDLTHGRHKDVLGDVECEFRVVDPKWLHHTMLRTNWFYEGAEVPALQIVYPDLQNRFEGEAGFDSRFGQPNLSTGSPMRKLELDLWSMTS